MNAATRNAEALWASLHDTFANAEEIIIKIIKTAAWEPLGYATFAEAWNDRLKGMRLPTDMMRAHVVYAMFDSGLRPAEVTRATGVGDRAVEALARQRESGVPAQLASTWVRAHTRNAPTTPRTLRVELTPDELTKFKDMCDARGLDVQVESVKALRAHFRALERMRVKA